MDLVDNTVYQLLFNAIDVTTFNQSDNEFVYIN